ncbi:MAG TPA: SdrD B-like domain-containing protein [Ilumatobacteraceae bacterium]|nr:SdrD B-like domain-containing protein [Ilumatobacteraceae bacterium]
MRIDGASRHRTMASRYADDVGVGARGRLRAGVLVVGALLVGVASLAPLSPDAVEAASTKITICHRTHSTTNPYRRITVSQNSVQNAKHGGHGLPNGSVNPAVFDSTFSYASNNKYWGDVIPGGDADGLPYNGTTSIAFNWTPAGKAIFFASQCEQLTPTAFYNAEIAAGQTQVDVLADLNSQDANEDIALLAALGGSFTASNMSNWSTAVSVTTNAATQLTATSATLNGSFTVGSTSTMATFQYGTSPTLATSTTTAATPSAVTNAASVTAAVTGLAPATTYYFTATGTTNGGTDTEGVLTGAIVSFTTPATTSTTTSTPPPTTTTTITPATTSTTSTTSTTTTITPATTSTTSPTTTTTPTTTTSPTTTTTVAVPVTTVPLAPTTTVPDAAEGSVHGVVWFDRNGNRVVDVNEWPLPGVTVTLDQPDSGARPESLRLNAATPRRTAITTTDGSYSFVGLGAGSYRVTAAAAIKGFDYTSDTDGATDWNVAVTVAAHAKSTADFAGLGHGEITGQVFDSTTLQGVAAATVSCSWSGYDDVVGNDDDVVFTLGADAAGSFNLVGIPFGFFTCDGRDSITQRQSSPVAATVFSSEAVNAPLPVGTHPTPLTTNANATLPRTGNDASTTIVIAFLLVMLGAAMTFTARARRTSLD